jgi:hypothetical protein
MSDHAVCTRTGRNQPQGKDLAFLMSLPSWTHGAIKPPEGYGIVGLDWTAQEIGIGAQLSGDPALIADYLAGDPHLQFAIRSGLAPEGATKESHGEIRDLIKPVSLGIAYGIQSMASPSKPASRSAGRRRFWRSGGIRIRNSLSGSKTPWRKRYSTARS